MFTLYVYLVFLPCIFTLYFALGTVVTQSAAGYINERTIYTYCFFLLAYIVRFWLGGHIHINERNSTMYGVFDAPIFCTYLH